jgi:hypothetical protein
MALPQALLRQLPSESRGEHTLSCVACATDRVVVPCIEKHLSRFPVTLCRHGSGALQKRMPRTAQILRDNILSALV